MLSGYEQSFSEQLILQKLGWKLGHSLHYTQLRFVYKVEFKVAVLLGKYFQSDTRPC